MSKPDPMGATFAERAAAANGDSSFDDPRSHAAEVEENSTFADRAKAVKKAVSSDGAENKAVGAKKTSRKKS